MPIGSYCLARQVISAARWALPGVPEYRSKWMIMLRMPKMARRCLSSEIDICPLCLACAKPLQDPERKGCKGVRGGNGCQAAANKRAEAMRKAEESLYLKNGFAALEAARAPQTRLKWKRVVEIYEVKGPDFRDEAIRALRLMIETPTGKALEDQFVADWSPALVRLFARMYQEYDRRGWTKRGTAPADAWEQIRAAHKRGELPELDYVTMRPANTTIRSLLGKAKAVIGVESRGRYLVEIEDEVPVLQWLLPKQFRLSLPVPDSRVLPAPEIYKAMWEALPLLRVSDPQLWLVLRLFWKTGLRTKEMAHVAEEWLEEEMDAEGKVTATLLILKNRVDFKLKGWRTAQVRALVLEADVLEVIDQVKVKGGSIFGVANKTQVENLLRESGAWIRQFVPEGPFTHRLFRKVVATVRADADGLEAAAMGMGHAKSSTTDQYYASKVGSVRALTDAELAPGVTVAKRRRVRASA